MITKDTYVTMPLTDDEILNAYYGNLGRDGVQHFDGCKAIAQAQLDKIIEWGEQICAEHGWIKHRKCNKCWQALKES